MKKGFIIFFLFVLPIISYAQFNNDEQNVIDELDKKSDEYFEVAKQIWDFAEVGFQEYKSSNLLQETLKENGFTVEAGVAEMPTAFIASFGSGEPIIGVLGEFDALPGITQTSSFLREKRTDVESGHACGHHLFGAGSAAAAIAIKNWMSDKKIKGTIRFYGTPAEEGGAGKVYMVRAGLFDVVSAVLHWHPNNRNSANASSSSANKSAKFRFYGKSSHAAVSPWKGRSALDGVEAMNDMVNMLREHMTPESRTHYVITEGGKAPNVIPDFAEVYYYVRHADMNMVEDNFERIVKCAEGAALGTETRMDYEIIHGLFNLLPNVTLSQIMYDNLSRIGGIKYNDEELKFAEGLLKSFENSENVSLQSAENINPFKISKKGSAGGSTDVGDVSWVVPTAGLHTATLVPGTSGHSWQAIACGTTTIAQKGMINAAKTISLTAMQLFLNKDVLVKAKEELIEQRGLDFKYVPLLGDRKPPLDYRD